MSDSYDKMMCEHKNASIIYGTDQEDPHHAQKLNPINLSRYLVCPDCGAEIRQQISKSEQIINSLRELKNVSRFAFIKAVAYASKHVAYGIEDTFLGIPLSKIDPKTMLPYYVDLSETCPNKCENGLIICRCCNGLGGSRDLSRAYIRDGVVQHPLIQLCEECQGYGKFRCSCTYATKFPLPGEDDFLPTGMNQDAAKHFYLQEDKKRIEDATIDDSEFERLP